MKSLTVNELFEKVWYAHWSDERFKSSGWAAEVHRLFTRQIMPTLGEKSILALKSAQIRGWHLDMKATPVNANRALEVLTKLYTFAEEKEWITPDQNPTRMVKAHKEKKRKRFATPQEIEKIVAIMEKEAPKNRTSVAFLYALLFSGARPRSLERATYEELEIVDHGGEIFGVLTFFGKSSAETGEDEQVILPPQAMKLIDGPDFHNKEDLIFGCKMPRVLWSKIRKEAGCPDLWARDLRRTFATVGLSNGVAIGIIGELLNHKSTQTTKRYAHLLQYKRLEATKTIADQISILIKGGK